MASVCDEERVQRDTRNLNLLSNEVAHVVPILNNGRVQDGVNDDTVSSHGNDASALVIKQVIKTPSGDIPDPKRLPLTSFSIYQSTRVMDEVHSRAAQMMGEYLLQKLRDAPYLHVGSVKEGACGIYTDIERMGGDSTTLRAIVDDYIADVKAFLLT